MHKNLIVKILFFPKFEFLQSKLNSLIEKVGKNYYIHLPIIITFTCVHLFLLALWCSGYHYRKVLFNKAHVPCRFKSCLRHVTADNGTAGSKTIRLSSVNHTTKTIQKIVVSRDQNGDFPSLY